MITILLVDDEVEVLDVYSDLLESMGHSVLRASDGLQALEVARRRHPDLVVTDWMMPRMNGVELCGELVREQELRDLPIIMHSSSGNPHAPGVVAFLPKSGDLERFEEVVTRTLDTTRQRTQQVCPPSAGLQQQLHRASQPLSAVRCGRRHPPDAPATLRSPAPARGRRSCPRPTRCRPAARQHRGPCRSPLNHPSRGARGNCLERRRRWGGHLRQGKQLSQRGGLDVPVRRSGIWRRFVG
ncbi:response regulator [Corallococcus sicarius]|uniref:Response regulator n=1 Tax=Corallococcus sicarius TaxID=2316726 RepID=A0A3A8NCJ1_9BACT|nr:response regulator [Corallococcus sicarius]